MRWCISESMPDYKRKFSLKRNKGFIKKLFLALPVLRVICVLPFLAHPHSFAEVQENTALLADSYYKQAWDALNAQRPSEARSYIEAFEAVAPPLLPTTHSRLAELQTALQDPQYYNIAHVSPHFSEEQDALAELQLHGHAQYLNGDFHGARRTFQEIEARAPDNPDAQSFQIKIAEALEESSGQLKRLATRSHMLKEVQDGWQRPQIIQPTVGSAHHTVKTPPLLEKLRNIRIPHIHFSGAKLSQIVETLSELSVEEDTLSARYEKGVNIVLFNPSDHDPEVTITLRNLTLDRILQLVTQSVNFQYDVDQDTIIVRRGDGPGAEALETQFFPISRSTVVRLTGQFEHRSTAPVDPFAPESITAITAPSLQSTESALKGFFQRAGVNFDNVPGATLAYDGSQLILTQTPRNLKRMDDILRHYRDAKQVEIETRFIEVQQSALEALGFSWSLSNGPNKFLRVFDPTNPVNINLRSLEDAFGGPRVSRSGGAINLAATATTPARNIDLNIHPPVIPRNINLGEGSTATAGFSGSVAGYTLEAFLTALEQTAGADLMSAPKLTVLSGKTARIVVAQELRYPESYGDIEAEVARGGDATLTSSGDSGVAITSGTPQDFTVRNVGVEMEVTPTVEEDDSISLILEPRVTEFEGFVEYGGPSVAISGGTTVNIPTGFFQPIFSTRAVQTEVTIYDGATVIMGGLTREEVVSVNDKVPLLGELPLIGRLFQSKSESSQKRNLLIFVTARLVSPGGSPARQHYSDIEPHTLYQQPTLMTPGGSIPRKRSE